MFNGPMRILILMGLFLFAACTKKPSAPVPLDKQGAKVYAMHCTACHNADPKKAGSIGPAIWGSSAELLEARLVHGTYPPGYKPQRDTKIMTLLPFLKDQIPALHAFLNTP
jgi:mono/diheme cytochrome c family protein